MKRIALILIAATLCMCGGCKQAHQISVRLKDGVPSRLTGVWTVVAGGEGRRSGALELRSNGKFVSRNLPDDILEDEDSSDDQILNGTGDWSFERDSDPRRVILTFRALQGANHPTLPVVARFDLEENRQVPQLSAHIGDPDEDERIALELTDAGEGTAK